MDAASVPESPIVVIGNGDEPLLPWRPESICFTFNGHRAPWPIGTPVDLVMSISAAGDPWIRAHGALAPTVRRDIEALLNRGLLEHRERLGCLPSTGYAVVHALWHVPQAVCIQRIRFDPSLVRPAHLPVRKPLPQAYHNWLGERRTTFARWLREPQASWSWSLVTDGQRHDADAATSAARVVDHLELLDAFNAAAQSGSVTPIRAISSARLLASHALLSGSVRMSDLEERFHLDRARSDTRNWWLYDAEASVYVDQIARNIRDAQHREFSHQRIRRQLGAEDRRTGRSPNPPNDTASTSA